MKATVGNSDNATSISWVSPFDKDNLFITRGTVSKGNDFVTAGPDKLLAVLRDPPGSNSYSYLEKGTTFTETSSFTGTTTIDGEETLVTDVGYDLITFTGVGVGTINQLEQSSGTEVSLTHTTEWEDSETKSSTTTINTTFTTSDSEDYVGAIELVEAGKVQLKPLISKIFPFAQYLDAYKYIDANRETTMKVIIAVQEK